MSDNIYTISEPLILPVRTADSEPVDIDILEANGVIAGIQKSLGTTDGEQVASQFRPWIAKKRNTEVEALTIGQVIELVDTIIDAANRAIEESKKKLATTLCSLFSTPESPGITENGQAKPKTPGSETTPVASYGQSELKEE